MQHSGEENFEVVQRLQVSISARMKEKSAHLQIKGSAEELSCLLLSCWCLCGTNLKISGLRILSLTKRKNVQPCFSVHACELRSGWGNSGPRCSAPRGASPTVALTRCSWKQDALRGICLSIWTLIDFQIFLKSSFVACFPSNIKTWESQQFQ